jgi:hypothetical protein
MSAPLPPVRGWQPRMPHRGIRCLFGRHKPYEMTLRQDSSPWSVTAAWCRRCKRPLELTAKNRNHREWR